MKTTLPFSRLMGAGGWIVSRLAALARELKEDSNPVLMITRFGKKGK